MFKFGNVVLDNLKHGLMLNWVSLFLRRQYFGPRKSPKRFRTDHKRLFFHWSFLIINKILQWIFRFCYVTVTIPSKIRTSLTIRLTSFTVMTPFPLLGCFSCLGTIVENFSTFVTLYSIVFTSKVHHSWSLFHRFIPSYDKEH